MSEQSETELTTKTQVVDELFADDASAVSAEQDIINSSRLVSEQAIPIPNKMGEIFSKWFQNSKKVVDVYHKDWLNNLKYFSGDNQTENQKLGFPQENIVRTTVETLLDYTYMRNPTATLSATEEGERELAETIQRALKTLVTRRAYPGINMRPKVAKQIVYSHLTNLGCLKVTFQPAKGSLSEAQKLFGALQKKIKSTTDTQQLETYYAGLQQVYSELESRNMFGIGLKVVSPFNLHIPAGCQEIDLSDCPRLMEEESISTAYIRSEYMIYDETEGAYRYRYDNSVLFNDVKHQPQDKATLAAAIVDQLLPDVDEKQREVIAENTTPCIWVYDRASRLIYLYIRDQWDTPLWVFQDELQLSAFYPHFLLEFSTILNSVYQRGEVFRYIPYQDEMNEIEYTRALIRRVASRIFTYDSNAIDKQEIDKVFSEIFSGRKELTAVGVKLKDRERRLEDCYSPLTLPIAQLEAFLDKTQLRDSVDRTTRVSEAQRGAEFKTNTTNEAIQTYDDVAQTRLSGLIDKIEEAVDRLFWAFAELIVSKYDKDTITDLVPARMAETFAPMTVAEFNSKYFMTIAAGSTEKMNSRNKKKEAASLIQGLGQFGRSAPQTTLKIIFRMIRESFSPELITDEDIDALILETTMMMQAGAQPEEEPAGDPSGENQQP